MIRYCIVDLVDLCNPMTNLSHNNSVNTMRLNHAGTKVIVKFDDGPDYAKELFAPYLWYTKHDMQIFVDNDEDWC